MFCPNCGSQLADASKFCPFCGTQLAQTRQAPEPVRQNPEPVQPGYPQNQNPYGYPQTQNPYGPSQSQNPYGNSQPQDPYAYSTPYRSPAPANPLDDARGMKWFKFIIYFQLFASAVLNTISAITFLTGAHYQGMADQVYSYFHGLKGLDVFYGILLLALAGFAIFVRQRLAKFRRNGPLLYYVLMIVSIVVSFIYLIAGSSILHVSLGEVMDASSLASIVTSIVMLVVNIIYFKKRADLFVN